MDMINPRLKSIILTKLKSDLENAVFYPCGREIWILELETKKWYFQTDNNGTLWYNQQFFNNFFNLFSLKSSSYQPILFEWFEKVSGLNQRVIARKNTDYEYLIENLLKEKKKNWTLMERYGFAYPIVKKYLDLKKNLKVKNIKVSDMFEYGIY